MPGMPKARVLFVDDEESVRDIAREFLQDEGIEVAVAAGVEEAIRLFNEGAFDAVITDYKMPGATGADLARHLRALRPGLPIVLLTGFLNTLDRQQLDSLFDDILEKPMGVTMLARAVLERMKAR